MHLVGLRRQLKRGLVDPRKFVTIGYLSFNVEALFVENIQ